MSEATSPLQTSRQQRDGRKLRNFRYFVLIWLLLAGVLNYMDRSSVAIAAPHIVDELGLTMTDIGVLGSVFSWTYALCQLPAGWLIDKVGSKRMFFLAVGLWSIATALMAAGQAMWQFVVFRVLLGVGESPNSPNSSKITTSWFPRSERGQATGIWDSGSKWGSAIAPPVLTVLSLALGWRAMFVIIGVAGILLAVCFLVWFRYPEESKHLSEEEYRHILAGRDEGVIEQEHIPWLHFFARPQTWGLIIGFFGSIWAWNIFITFLPLYLQTTLGVTVAGTGLYAALPYVVAALTAIFGGRLSVILVRRGRTPLRSKRLLIVGGSIWVGILLVVLPLMRSLWSAEIVLCLALAGVALVQSQSWAITSDLVPDRQAAQFGGIMNFGGYFGGALAPILTGAIYDSYHSYTPSFMIAGAIAFIGAAAYGLLLRKPMAKVNVG
ncbi:MFS transporter [Microlunatus soli]|uniref:Sugar phosphate permease n=1 Tax=Microlunatus soli TaxID=630515 RepID=A0A1H1YP54_9ACTN|nr:MFS transporter [Microlunatus soli]SDT23214.1 Sugar phosphate permease [Microlunatus soli]